MQCLQACTPHFHGTRHPWRCAASLRTPCTFSIPFCRAVLEARYSMACTACALHCQLQQLSNAQASCSARTLPLAMSKAQYTTCTRVAGVCHGSRHQQPLRHGSLHAVQQLRCAASNPDSTAEVSLLTAEAHHEDQASKTVFMVGIILSAACKIAGCWRAR